MLTADYSLVIFGHKERNVFNVPGFTVFKTKYRNYRLWGMHQDRIWFLLLREISIFIFFSYFICFLARNKNIAGVLP